MSKGSRNNKGKLPMHLISTYAARGLAKVLTYGVKKYAEWNWSKGLDIAECMDSMERHIMAIKEGDFYDEESGLPHVDHLLTNAMFLSHFHHTGMWDENDQNLQYNNISEVDIQD